MTTVRIGDEDRRIEPFSARKVNRALKLLRYIGEAVPDILSKRAEFIRTYEQENAVEIDRAQAIIRYGAPIPVLGPEGDVVRNEDGSPVTVKAPIMEMGEEAWVAAGQKLRLPQSPDVGAQTFALLPMVQDRAEHLLYQLLALVLMPNSDVRKHDRDGSLFDRTQDGVLVEGGEGKLRADAEDLLDEARPEQLLELAVVAGEIVDDQIIGRARELRERLGNALRLFGLSPDQAKTEEATTTSSGQTSEPTPSSSSDGAAPSGSEQTSSTSTTS